MANSSIRHRPTDLRPSTATARPAAAISHSGRGRPRLAFGERLRDLLLVLVLFCFGGATLAGYATFRIWQVGRQDGRRDVDAIVVLGAAQYNGRPTDVLAARLDHAIELYKAGYAPYLITTGSNQPGDWTTEAEVGRKYAISHGVPASAILIENTSHNTLQQMQNVKALLDTHGMHTVLFVSDRNHMLRVLRLAQDQGIEGWSSPTDTSPDDTNATLFRNSMVHEFLGLGQYLFLNADSDSPGGSTNGSTTASSPSPSS